jgi:hypothetical protein
MLTLEEKKRIRQMLPYGAGKEIAKIAGVHCVSVSRWFNGSANSCLIEDVALSLMAKYKTELEAKKKLAGLE